MFARFTTYSTRMLKATLQVSAMPSASDTFTENEVKIRVSVDSTPEHIDAQLREAFGLDGNATLSLSSDGELCSLHTVVHSIRRWIEAGNSSATPEYDCVLLENKATFPLTLKVKNGVAANSKSTASNNKSTGSHCSEDSEKRKREHREWEKLAWEVR
jgi:hypothetical protein